MIGRGNLNVGMEPGRALPLTNGSLVEVPHRMGVYHEVSLDSGDGGLRDDVPAAHGGGANGYLLPCAGEETWCKHPTATTSVDSFKPVRPLFEIRGPDGDGPRCFEEAIGHESPDTPTSHPDSFLVRGESAWRARHGWGRRIGTDGSFGACCGVLPEYPWEGTRCIQSFSGSQCSVEFFGPLESTK